MPDAFVVEVTLSAADDLRSIHTYIRSHASRSIGDEMLDKLVERCAALDQFPMRGSIPEELAALGNDEFRQLVVGKYRIFCSMAERHIRIVLIADGRRDMQELLRRRLLLTPPDWPR